MARFWFWLLFLVLGCTRPNSAVKRFHVEYVGNNPVVHVEGNWHGRFPTFEDAAVTCATSLLHLPGATTGMYGEEWTCVVYQCMGEPGYFDSFPANVATDLPPPPGSIDVRRPIPRPSASTFTAGGKAYLVPTVVEHPGCQASEVGLVQIEGDVHGHPYAPSPLSVQDRDKAKIKRSLAKGIPYKRVQVDGNGVIFMWNSMTDDLFRWDRERKMFVRIGRNVPGRTEPEWVDGHTGWYQ